MDGLKHEPGPLGMSSEDYLREVYETLLVSRAGRPCLTERVAAIETRMNQDNSERSNLLTKYAESVVAALGAFTVAAFGLGIVVILAQGAGTARSALSVVGVSRALHSIPGCPPQAGADSDSTFIPHPSK